MGLKIKTNFLNSTPLFWQPWEITAFRLRLVPGESLVQCPVIFYPFLT